MSGLIKIDAAIQAGDSGGPLYGDAGTIIGMATAASSARPADAYAIPIATARGIAAQIGSGVDNATIHQGLPAFLGGSMQDTVSGPTVAGVFSGGAADSAGITAGDVITAIDGTAVASPQVLGSTLAGYAPGERVTVSWTTPQGAAESTTVILGTGPAD